MPEYTVTDSNVHIVDSYQVSKHDMEKTLTEIRNNNPGSRVWKRPMASMKAEWRCHNFLYALGIARERTGSADLNYPLKWFISAAYYIGGALVYPFIR